MKCCSIKSPCGGDHDLSKNYLLQTRIEINKKEIFTARVHSTREGTVFTSVGGGGPHPGQIPGRGGGGYPPTGTA